MSFQSVSVGLTRPYQISIGHSASVIEQQLAQSIVSDQVFVISSETVAELYLDVLRPLLSKYHHQVHIIPDGESEKNIQQFEQGLKLLIEGGFRRNVTMIALGGGVVGDLTGFIAACYQRGVPYIQLPTTLLAMVDSSVGGKTAINMPSAKNMVGAFYQPRAVIANLAFLASLPRREYLAGLAEVIKYGLIADVALLEMIESSRMLVEQRDPEVLAFLVKRSCEIKAQVVEQDETEQGLRAILNLGHTFGHAIEKLGNYQDYVHGEAVAIGTCMAFKLSQITGRIDEAYYQRVCQLYRSFGLPTAMPESYSVDAMIAVMRHDKKNLSNAIRLVLPTQVAKVEVVEFADHLKMADAIVAHRGGDYVH